MVRFVHPTKVGCYNICRAYGSVESSGSLPLSLTAMTGREAQPFSLRFMILFLNRIYTILLEKKGVVTPLSFGEGLGVR